MSFKISGYTTVRNAVQMDYPFEQAIESALRFCDEICVLDSSDCEDGTQEKLATIQGKFHGRVKFHHENVDWSAPNHGIFDGKTKQMAREMCKGQYLWQFDSDEIVHEEHASLVKPLIPQISQAFQKTPILTLPVIEFWGRYGKVRIDVNPWKERLSLNVKDIVHGIPAQLRWTDPVSGLEYSRHGSDSCNLISRATGEPYPMISFMPQEANAARVAAVTEQPGGQNLKSFEMWFNAINGQLPGVYHYSWFSIERKIKQYRSFWTGFWKALYNETRDERENPFFPGLLWSEVTDKMIAHKAELLERECGGHIFHSPWQGQKTNSVRIFKDHPAIMKQWIKEHV